MNGKIVLVITALFVIVSSVWGAKTEIPDLKVIAQSKDSYIYSGHVILIETGKPMSKRVFEKPPHRILSPVTLKQDVES